jgi:hypothetical protein
VVAMNARLRVSRGPHADARPRADARAGDGGIGKELAAGMTGRVESIRALSSEIRGAFESWLATACRGGARLVVLEGLSGSGKSVLTDRPFSIGARHSANIEIDQFLPKSVPPTVRYPNAIDRAALQAALQGTLASCAGRRD